MVPQGDTPTPDGSTSSARPPRRPRRRWRWMRRALVILCAMPVVFAIVAATLVIDREITVPAWLKAQVEHSASDMMQGGTLQFGSIRLIIGRDLHPRVRLRNAVIRDADQRTLARIPAADVLISPRGLILTQEVLVQEVVLRGTQIGLLRSMDGSVAVSFEAGDIAAGEAESFVDLLDQVDRILDAPELVALDHVRAEGIIVNFDDARVNRSWTMDGGTIDLDMTGQMVQATAGVSLLSGRAFATRIDVHYESPVGSRASVMGMTVRQGMAADLALEVPVLGWLSVLDAPITASIRASVEEGGALGPVYASVAFEEGSIQPTPETRPISIRSGRTYLSYLPAQDLLRFDRVAAETAWGKFEATGQAFMRSEDDSPWPDGFEAQFTVTDISLNPDGVYAEAKTLDRVSADFRLTLDPFGVEVGGFSLSAAGQSLTGKARIGVGDTGWDVAVDLAADQLEPLGLMAFWPQSVQPVQRRWVTENLFDVSLRDVRAGLRLRPGSPPQIAATGSFFDSRFRPNKHFPDVVGAQGFVSLAENGLNIQLETGTVTAPQGGQVDISGSRYRIMDVTQRRPMTELQLHSESTVTAALALVDLPPHQFLTKAGQSVTMVDGRASVDLTMQMPLAPKVPPQEIRFQGLADLRNLRSETLVPGKVVTAQAMTVEIDNRNLSVAGTATVGQSPIEMLWSKSLGVGVPATGDLLATVTLDPAFLQDFNITLPAGMVAGSSTGQLAITLSPEAAPEFRLTSRLVGTSLSIPQIGWEKPREAEASLTVAGTLGPVPTVDQLEISGDGLTATGSLSLTADKQLDRVTFSQVTVGDWFAGPVSIIGRGPGAQVGLVIAGGTLDLSRANLATGDQAEGGPLTVVLDRLTIGGGLTLDGFRGEFANRAGFYGSFTGRLNGVADIAGQLETTAKGPAIRVTAEDGGSIMVALHILPNATGGPIEITLMPTGETGSFDGAARMTDLQVREAPTLAALLDAVSVVGLLQQLGGQGLMFGNAQAEFRIRPGAVSVVQSSAVGAGLGISLDGIYRTADQSLDFQGVVSPLYLINGLGSVISRQGEGLLGFNYSLTGTSDRIRIGVNPLSVLTPGFLRDIFRRSDLADAPQD